MVSLKNYSVLNGEKDDQVLHVPSFNVNMRLLETSESYKEILDTIQQTMIETFDKKYSDYVAIQGLSGPNIGIPLRIIAIRIKKPDGEFLEGVPNYFKPDPETPSILFMLNPEIFATSPKIYIAKSNCGSLILKEQIQVRRYEWVEVSYNDFTGERFAFRFRKPVGSTIQHEIDHLNGILILEKQVEEKTTELQRPHSSVE